MHVTAALNVCHWLHSPWDWLLLEIVELFFSVLWMKHFNAYWLTMSRLDTCCCVHSYTASVHQTAVEPHVKWIRTQVFTMIVLWIWSDRCYWKKKNLFSTSLHCLIIWTCWLAVNFNLVFRHSRTFDRLSVIITSLLSFHMYSEISANVWFIQPHWK